MREYFLITDRLGFSEWKEEDIDLARSLWGDENVTKYICATGKFTEPDIMNRLQSEIENGKRYGVQYWPIFDLKTEDIIGCCGLRPYDLKGKIYEIGFHLRSLYWGKGLAPEAAKAVIHFAFDSLHASDLFAGHNPNNANSKKVLERLGFLYTGDEYYAPTGLYHPSYRYQS
jgi:ribosomal-protein-alanine N-acetyltransferase